MIPDRAKQLNSAKGFYEVWIENLSKEDLSHHDAYLKTEEEHAQYYGENKYTNFHSFRNSQRWRIQNNRLKEKNAKSLHK